MRYSKIDSNPNLFKDQITGAILNTNSSEYENYLSLKSQKEKDNLKIHKIESEMKSLKNDIMEIKYLLRSLINGSK